MLMTKDTPLLVCIRCSSEYKVCVTVIEKFGICCYLYKVLTVTEKQLLPFLQVQEAAS